MSKRSSSCRRDFLSLIRFPIKRQSSDCRSLNILCHEGLNSNVNKRGIFNDCHNETVLSGKIYKLVEKEKFNDCIGLVKDLTHEQVDKIARDLPVALILSKIPKSLKLIEALYSKNTKYFSDKNHPSLTNTMPPDILLNHLIAWVYSLDQQRFNWKAFQSHKQSFIKTLKHIFASSPILRNKLTKKLISLERSLDSATQESRNPLHTIHPLLLKVCDSQNRKTNQTVGGNALESLWETGIDKLKQDFVAMFCSSLSEQTSQHSDSNITIETIERRLYNHRRMLDAIEPLENVIVHVAKQLRRSMETNKEVIFNCVQISKELNLSCNLSDSMNSKQPLPLSRSAPLVFDLNSPIQQTQSQPSSLSTSSAFQTSIAMPHLSSPQEVPSPSSTCFSKFLVVPFLSRLVRSYSRVVALITDDQLGPRVVFNTDSEDSSPIGRKFKKKLSSHSFNEFWGKNNNNNNRTPSKSLLRRTKYHTLPKSLDTIKPNSNGNPILLETGNNLFKEEKLIESCSQLESKKGLAPKESLHNNDDDDATDGKHLLVQREKTSEVLETPKKTICRSSGFSKNLSTMVEKQLIGLYSNMYHVMRTEALGALNDIDELQTCGHLKNKLLLSILVLAFRSVRKCYHHLKEEVQRLLEDHLDLTGYCSNHNWILAGLINLYLKGSAMNQHILRKKAKEVYEKVMATLDNYPCLLRTSKLLPYAENAIRLCWFMVVEIPSLVLCYDGKEFDPSFHERYLSSDSNSSSIKAFLWPGLYDGVEGRCLFKAVVVT